MLILASPGLADAQTCPSLTGYEDFGLGNQGAGGVAISGHYAFTADTYGMSVYDVSDMASPQRVAQVLLPDSGAGIELVGTRAFVAVSDSSLEVFDISDPRSPSIIGSVKLPGRPLLLVMSGTMAYVSYLVEDYYSTGLQVIDVSDPAHPTLRGAVGPVTTPDGYPSTLYYNLKSGPPGFLYGMTYSPPEFLIIDVSDPDNPTISWPEITSSVSRVSGVSGNILYCGGSVSSAAVVIDISDPLVPVVLREVEMPHGLGIGEVQGNRLFVSTRQGFDVIDISDPGYPKYLSSLTSSGGGRLAVTGDTVVLAGSSDAFLSVVDVSDPTAPTEKAVLDLRGFAYRVAARGDLVYVGNGSTLKVVDVSDPGQPVLRGSLELSHAISDAIYRVRASGSLALLMERRYGLQIVDVSDPDLPRLIGSYTPSHSSWGLAVSGSRAYLALGTRGIDVVDVSDPSHPRLMTHIDWFTTDDVWAFGSILYRENWSDCPGCMAFEALDVTDPANPVVLGNFPSGPDNRVADLAAAGRYVVAAKEDDGIQIFDARTLHPVGSVAIPGSGESVEVLGNMAVVGCWEGSVVFVDIGDPENPTIVGSIDTRREVYNAVVNRTASTVWTAGGAIVEGVRADCVSCAGLDVSVATNRIPTGGAKTILTVGVSDLTGTPAPGQTVTGTSTAGSLSDFTDNDDGTYSAVYTSGSEPETVQIGVSVNGEACSRSATIQVGPEPCTARRTRSRAQPTADR